MLSVIIPTLNRSDFLQDAIHSLLNQSIPEKSYEIIVVDNGSKDKTREVVEILQKRNNRIRYCYEKKPGLHHGRHRGGREARGEILTFTDDDIIASPKWLEMIADNFSSTDVALVGGKVLPRWEGEVPEWIDHFRSKNKFGWTIGYLSLLDFGERPKEIPGKFVFGCNFSIRKEVLFKCGGFHPDGMPQDLIRYRGDGETALAKAIQNKGYKIIYAPGAVVYHRIPEDRLTVTYFCKRAFNQGISESFAKIRRKYGMGNHLGAGNRHLLRELEAMFTTIYRKSFKVKKKKTNIQKEVKKAFEKGKRFHREQVKSNPELLKYVLQKNYIENS